MGNRVVYADMMLKPESLVNFISKEKAGLELTHVKSKCQALFIKNFLNEAASNCHASALLKKYCYEEDVHPTPWRPLYLTDALISKIKLVCRKLTSGITTQNIYKILLNEEFSIDETLTLKIEMKNPMLCLEKFVEVNKSKLLSQPVRSFSWKLFHNLLFVETEEARIKNRSPICSTCGETDIDQIHIYFRCPKLKGIGQILMKILKIFDPEFSEEEVLAFQLQNEFPQANWVTLNTLFYIYK